MTTEAVFTYLPQERVISGVPAARAVAEEVARRKAERVFILASRSLADKSPVVRSVEEELGTRVVGRFTDCVAHTPRDSVIAAAAAVRESGADLIVTLGGGTPIDTGKILQICLAHDITTIEGLDHYHIRVDADGQRFVPTVGKSQVRQIVVPTTLSGAEFSALGGSTDPRTGAKHSFYGAEICAAAVILDPAATLYTPESLWLSSGIRAVDHAVEALCGVAPSPMTDALAAQALEILIPALHATRRDPQDLEARQQCQHGAWLAGSNINRVSFGASHGIGHVLGGLAGVPHGITSCVMLPSVMRWNAAHVAGPLAGLARRLGTSDPAAVVAELIAALGLPTRVRDTEVREDQLETAARLAMDNLWVRTNPRPIRSPEDVMEILRLAW